MRFRSSWSAPATRATLGLYMIAHSASVSILSGNGSLPYGNLTLPSGSTVYGTVSLVSLSSGTGTFTYSTLGTTLPLSNTGSGQGTSSTLLSLQSTTPLGVPNSTRYYNSTTPSSSSSLVINASAPRTTTFLQSGSASFPVSFSSSSSLSNTSALIATDASQVGTTTSSASVVTNSTVSSNSSGASAGVTIGIVTTVVIQSDTTVTKPIITGGGIFPATTLPPATTTLANAEATSAVSSVSSQVALLIPVIINWKANPKPLKSDTINGIKDVKSDVEGLISKLGSVPLSKPCVRAPKRKRNLFGSITKIVSSLSCIDENLDSITAHVNTDNIQGIDGALNDLTSVNDDLTDGEDDNNSNTNTASASSISPSATSATGTVTGTAKRTDTLSKSSSSSSCTSLGTALHVTVQCASVTVSHATSTFSSISCAPTATFTASGCSVTGTTTTIFGSPSSNSTRAATDKPCARTACGTLCPTGGSPSSVIQTLTGACPAIPTSTVAALPTASYGIYESTTAAYPSGSASALLKKDNSVVSEHVFGLWPESSKLISKRILSAGEAAADALALAEKIEDEEGWLDIESADVTATYQPYTNQDGRLGIKGLWGCTSIIINSGKGVYRSHVYEEGVFFNFKEDDPDEEDPERIPTSDAFFTSTAFDALRDGAEDVQSIAELIGSDQKPGDLHRDRSPRIFLITPIATKADRDHGVTTQLRYDTRARSLASSVAKLIFGSELMYTTIGYNPTSLETSNDETKVKGKALIDFSPQQYILESGANGKKVSVGQWRLWVDGRVVTSVDFQNPSIPPNPERQNIALLSTCGTNSNVSTASTESPVSPESTLSSIRANSTLITLTTAAPLNSSTNSASPSIALSTLSHGPTTKKASITATTTPTPTFTVSCNAYQDPHAGPAPLQCECEGLDGIFCPLSSSSGATSFNPCGYTTSPTPCASTAQPFTVTQSDGAVVSCASSSYYDYGINTVPTCAGSTQVVSTVASIASAYSASVAASISASSASAASASASASYAAAAAVPSAYCNILSDWDVGSSFEVGGINGWAGNGGTKLNAQENGCGEVDGWDFQINQTAEFDGKRRDTQIASFGLSFFKGGCVERAVHSAGGPAPGHDPGQLACQHVSNLNAAQLIAANRIVASEISAYGAMANGSSEANSSLPVSIQEEAVATSPIVSTLPTVLASQSNPNLVASASAALPNLLALQSSLSAALAAATAT